MSLIDIEKSIIKTYRKKIWHPFIKAIEEYNLIEDGDCIAVCISGGKDSMLLAKCFQELKKHGKDNFDLKFIVMDPGYQPQNRDLIISNLNTLGIEAEIFNSNVFEIADATDSPCYMCARMRRGCLYKKAQTLGCNKIALGHHFDDVVETILLNLLYAGEYKTMMPKLYSDNYKGMQLIRPLYYVREKDIVAWARYNNLHFINCACQVTVKHQGKRQEVKALLQQLEKQNPYAAINIFRSSYNVNLDAIIGGKRRKEYKNFLDDYKDSVK